jgi:hypothetical protein
MSESKNENKSITIRKIDIYSLIGALAELYNSGADFVDIIGENHDKHDKISLLVKDEYINEDAEYEDEDGDDEESTSDDDDVQGSDLSNLDINDLV